jgi:hypothetical protein
VAPWHYLFNFASGWARRCDIPQMAETSAKAWTLTEVSEQGSAASELETLLMAIDGVASVFIEEAEGSPVSTSLRLSDNADEAVVSAAVNEVLSGRGLRTQGQAEAPTEVLEDPVVDHGFSSPNSQPPQILAVSPARVQTAEIIQTSEGLRVSVRLTDGRTAERVVEPGGDQIRMAVVAIVGVLLGVVGARLTQYKVEEFAGRRAVTVIIERGSLGTGVGTAFESGTVFEKGTVELAIARATWAAILG